MEEVAEIVGGMAVAALGTDKCISIQVERSLGHALEGVSKFVWRCLLLLNPACNQAFVV